MQEQRSENCQDSSKEKYKCLVSQTVYWHRDNQTDQCNRVGNSETDPFLHGNLTDFAVNVHYGTRGTAPHSKWCLDYYSWGQKWTWLSTSSRSEKQIPDGLKIKVNFKTLRSTYNKLCPIKTILWASLLLFVKKHHNQNEKISSKLEVPTLLNELCPSLLPKFICWNPSAILCWRGGPLGGNQGEIWSRGWGPHDGMSALIRRDTRSRSLSLCHVSSQWKSSQEECSHKKPTLPVPLSVFQPTEL